MTKIPDILIHPENRFNLIPPNVKVPVDKTGIPDGVKWTQEGGNRAWDDPYFQRKLRDGYNYGVCCGFGEILVIDFDDEDLHNELKDKMPKTFTVKSPSRGYHYYYQLPNFDDGFKVPKDYKVDFQWFGKQAIGPGSKTPKGEYKVVNDVHIAKISADTVLSIFPIKLQSHEVKKLYWPETDYPVSSGEEELLSKIDFIKLGTEFGYEPHLEQQMCKMGHGSQSGKCAGFYWDQGKVRWKCFNCGDAGPDPVVFYMHHKGIKNRKDALIELGERYGIPKKKFRLSNEQKSEMRENTYEQITGLLEQWHAKRPFVFTKEERWYIYNDVENRYIETTRNNMIGYFDPDNIYTFLSKPGYRQYLFNQAMQVGSKYDTIPDHYITFKDCMVDLLTLEIMPKTSRYFVLDTIPWNLGKDTKTPIIDKLFAEWQGEEGIVDCHEKLAYTFIKGYPIQEWFLEFGPGGNGKGTYLNILRKILGTHNFTAGSLHGMSDAFGLQDIIGKRAIICGEIDDKEVKHTAILKQLTGGDAVRIDIKYANPITYQNYAKIYFATNAVPQKADMSEGFYRRANTRVWKNKFDDEKGNKREVIEEITKTECENCCRKWLEIAHILKKTGRFTNTKSTSLKRAEYDNLSNPMMLFLDQCVVVTNSPENEVQTYQLYEAYNIWALKNGYQQLNYSKFCQRWAVPREVLINKNNVSLMKIRSEIDGETRQRWTYIGIMLQGFDQSTQNLGTAKYGSGSPFSPNISTISTPVPRVVKKVEEVERKEKNIVMTKSEGTLEQMKDLSKMQTKLDDKKDILDRLSLVWSVKLYGREMEHSELREIGIKKLISTLSEFGGPMGEDDLLRYSGLFDVPERMLEIWLQDIRIRGLAKYDGKYTIHPDNL